MIFLKNNVISTYQKQMNMQLAWYFFLIKSINQIIVLKYLKMKSKNKS